MTKEEYWEKYESDKLCDTYPDYFDIWWDREKFDWLYSYALAEFCNDHFDKWWDENKFDWSDSYALARHCNNHFDIWWNPDKFDWENDSVDLVQYCSFKFSDLQLKQLCLHEHKNAREFAVNELKRRK